MKQRDQENEEARLRAQVRLIKRLILGMVAGGCSALIAVAALACVYGARQASKADQLQKELEQLRLADLVKVEKAAPSPEPSFSYQENYPDLYVQAEKQTTPAQGTVYLTFDDGPSAGTAELLDTLDALGIKATFFLVGTAVDRYPEIVQEIARRGHSIGIHANDHDYAKLYASVDSFLEDYQTVSRKVEELTGKRPSIFRFPGGSINFYNRDLYMQLIAEMVRRGYTYYDWNVSAEDAVATPRTSAVIKNDVKEQIGNHSYSIVLMHDSAGKASTIEAVRELVPELQSQGYVFAALDNTVKPITFSYQTD